MQLQSEQVKEVGVWVRVSTEDQVRGESPEHHEKRARAYAEAKGWRVVELYLLGAVSGKAVIAHPEAQRMLADVKSGRITALVFSKLARLARNTKELLEFAELFRRSGADLVSLQEAIDTSSPALYWYCVRTSAAALKSAIRGWSLCQGRRGFGIRCASAGRWRDTASAICWRETAPTLAKHAFTSPRVKTCTSMPRSAAKAMMARPRSAIRSARAERRFSNASRTMVSGSNRASSFSICSMHLAFLSPLRASAFPQSCGENGPSNTIQLRPREVG